MKNISKTDKKILNEFEINYLVLLLNASISKLNSNSEIVSDEYSNLIEVLKAFDYVDKNLEKQEKNHPGENISISEWDSASELTNPVSEDGYLCGATGCGLCTLKQLSDTGITHLKLVGRGNYTDFMERDIRNLRRTLEILEDSSTEEEYIRAMKAELFPNGCSHMCYAR